MELIHIQGLVDFSVTPIKKSENITFCSSVSGGNNLADNIRTEGNSGASTPARWRSPARASGTLHARCIVSDLTETEHQEYARGIIECEGTNPEYI